MHINKFYSCQGQSTLKDLIIERYLARSVPLIKNNMLYLKLKQVNRRFKVE